MFLKFKVAAWLAGIFTNISECKDGRAGGKRPDDLAA
jgi:hypothetical protein